jgi:hypothetical protein
VELESLKSGSLEFGKREHSLVKQRRGDCAITGTNSCELFGESVTASVNRAGAQAHARADAAGKEGPGRADVLKPTTIRATKK